MASSTMRSTDSVTAAGDLVSSLKRMPAGVARCARDGAGTHLGSSLLRSSCHWPGSKSVASSAACSLAEPSACTCDGCEKKRSSSGTRRYGTVRYCSSSSASGGRSAPSKEGSCFRWSTSSSRSIRTSTPSSLLTSCCGSADDGGARGLVTPNTLRSLRSSQDEFSACSACLVIAAALSVRPKAETTNAPDEASCRHERSASSGIHGQISGSASEVGTMSILKRKTMSRKKPSSGKFSSSSRDSPERYAGSSEEPPAWVWPCVAVGKAMCRQSWRSSASSATPNSIERSNPKRTRLGRWCGRCAAK
mmetsp:Transcript_38582/g.127362  ORF Transcript_38582/g.127362 Transcript_38582/m.127362 type:complete len:306 (-) Transcript_38582:219-1136(-)